MKLFHYTVEGNDPFPFDMLRYEQAWPANNEDAIKLGFRRVNGNFFVNLIGVLDPTSGRWESFGWRIIEYRGKNGLGPVIRPKARAAIAKAEGRA